MDFYDGGADAGVSFFAPKMDAIFEFFSNYFPKEFTPRCLIGLMSEASARGRMARHGVLGGRNLPNMATILSKDV